MHLLRPVQPVVRESRSAYRPRNPERTVLYRTIRDDFRAFTHIHEERFEREDGSLRPVVTEAVGRYLDCGILQNGFARVRCPECRAEYLVPFSCRTRNLCGSCQQKRAELLAEKLREEILAPVPHRHVIFTIPVALRRLFLRERRLLGLLTRCAFETVRRCFLAVLDKKDGVPGMVAALQTFGSQLQWNPHVHALVSDGLLRPGGAFVPMPMFDERLEEMLTETFRRLLLTALVREERLTEGFRDRLLTFRHGGGFSVYGRHLILNEEPARLAHMARYAVRPPVAMDRIGRSEDGRILLSIPPALRTGATVLALDPMEFLRRITNQIPAPKTHTVRYYGAYANRSRRIYREEEDEAGAKAEVPVVVGEEDQPGSPSSNPDWARLLRNVYEVDPLACPRCGAEMRIVAVITVPRVIDRILKHLAETRGDDLFSARAPPAA